MSVVPSSYTLEVGLQPNGSFPEILINEQHVVSAWPLSELNHDSLAQDIVFGVNPGTYVGSGWTRGVTFDIPDGCLAGTLAGGEYVLVPDDGSNGYTRPGESSGRTLSCPDGDLDIAFLIKTSHSSATVRAIVQKQETDDSGIGWHVALVSGAIRFTLITSGGSVFSFDRGAVSDGALHTIHCNYQSALGEARVFIDGVQSGATVSVAPGTEPEVNTGDLRIGMFNDGVAGDGSGFIGSLAYVMVGREGSPTLGVRLHATRTWTALTDDVRQLEPIRWRYGIQGSSVLDNVARPGTLTFLLDNSTNNAGGVLGYYSPGHASVRSGFGVGIPVRFSVTYGGTVYYKFRGRITSVRPVPGQYGSRAVAVSCTDWFGVASQLVLSAVEARTDERSDEVLRAVLDQAAGRTPPAVDITVGSSTFPFALDVGRGESESILTEGTRVTSSERGYWYQRGDTVQGGTMVWEGRGDRQIHTDLDATFSNTLHGLEVAYGFEYLINIVLVIVTPRRVDASATTVLYRLEASEQDQPIAPQQTLVLTGGYTDPSQTAAGVGGVAMVSPVANTDYAFWSNSDGTGTDLAADLTVRHVLGGSSFRVELTNEGSGLGYLRLNASTAFQLRGKGVYHYTPVVVERRNADSVRRHGPRTIQIELPYESSVAAAESVADFILGVLSDQRGVPTSLSLLGNHSHALMVEALAREPGDKVGVVETVTGLTTDDPDSDALVGYFINEVQGEYAAGGIVRTTWTLSPSSPTGAGIFDESAFDEDLVFGF